VFKISDFSKLSQVSMRTLRYYDEIGLLKPIHVDSDTGYRYYLVEQLSRLQRILALKDLGFELAQIVQVLDEDLPPEQLRGMLRLKQHEMQQRVQAEQERLARIEARLKQLEAGGTRPSHEVALKKVRSQIVASTRTLAANFTLKNQLATDLLNTLKKHSVRQTDHLLFIDSEGSYRENDMNIIEIVVPVQSSSVGNIVERSGGRITIRELPAVNTMATLLYQGNPYTLSEAYQPLGTWIQANDYVITGSCRKVCLQREGDLDSHVTEIQFPVEKKDATRQSFSHVSKRGVIQEPQSLLTLSE
jgi:DNA-binding transcriptional MerR regulator